MTRHTAEKFDMTGFLSAETLPTDEQGRPQIQTVMRRGATETWHSRVEPVHFDKPDVPLDWSRVRDGDLVRIPMIPYRSANDPASLALLAMAITQRYVEAFPRAVRTHIVLGTPIETLELEDGSKVLRLWVGFTAQTS